MRHYTNTKGINGIRDANNIAASNQNLVFAVTKRQMKKTEVPVILKNILV